MKFDAKIGVERVAAQRTEVRKWYLLDTTDRMNRE
jgi:hypothetical protein